MDPFVYKLFQKAKGIEGGMQLVQPINIPSLTGMQPITSPYTQYTASPYNPFLQANYAMAGYSSAMVFSAYDDVRSEAAVLNVVETFISNWHDSIANFFPSVIYSSNGTGAGGAEGATGLRSIVDDGTVTPVQGGIDKTVASNAFWKFLRYGYTSGTQMTISTLINDIARIAESPYNGVAGGAPSGVAPVYGVMSSKTMRQFVTSITGTYSIQARPDNMNFVGNISAGYNGLYVNDTYLYSSVFYPVHGEVLFLHPDNFDLIYHKQHWFRSPGFEKLQMQDVYGTYVVVFFNLIQRNPRGGGVVTGYSYAQ